MANDQMEEIRGAPKASVELRLFVAGDTPPSARARRELKRLRAELKEGGLRVDVIDVIDVLERPDLAEEERILATPVLIRVHPPPRRSIVGDLSDWQAVAQVLDLAPGTPKSEPEGRAAR